VSSSRRNPTIIPPILEKVPRAVIRALDPTRLLMNAVPLLNPPTNIGPVIALGSVDTYLEAARRQQQRIKRAKSAFLKHVHSGRLKRDNLFNEIHFYLICWARIAKLGGFIRDKTRFKHVGLVLRHYHTEFQKRIDCRDHLEHFEERLPGGVKQSKLQVPGDLLNMMNEHVTYGGRKLDVGPASLALLQTIVAELRAAILYDAVETLAAADSKRLADSIERAATNIQIAKILKATQKGLGLQDLQIGR
jgi:hypothetical protein